MPMTMRTSLLEHRTGKCFDALAAMQASLCQLIWKLPESANDANAPQSGGHLSNTNSCLASVARERSCDF